MPTERQLNSRHKSGRRDLNSSSGSFEMYNAWVRVERNVFVHFRYAVLEALKSGIGYPQQ